MLTEPPLLGRDEELGRLKTILGRVRTGLGGLVLISGEAGIGKTRLASEFEEYAMSLDCRVLVGSCLPSANIPYLVFLQVMNDLLKEEHQKKADWARLSAAGKKAAPAFFRAVPIVGSTLAASAVLFDQYGESGRSRKGSQESVLFKILGLLRERSSTRSPLILHLDDLQWADSASIATLHFLARNSRDLPVLLLGTYRTEEVLNREEGIHPFLESLRVMKREGLVEEVNLKPLAGDDLRQVVLAMLEHPLQDDVLERILKESEGSPLFAVETMRMLATSGSLVLQNGRYNIPGSMADLIPSSVKEVILRRIERTSRKQRRTLDSASVVGQVFDPEVLGEAVKESRVLILELLEQLDHDHQLVKEREIDYVFTHEKIRKFTYDAISTMRRKELHRAVGVVLESRLPDETLYPVLAYHFHQAMEVSKCVDYSLLAGEYCASKWAPSEAISYFNLTLESLATEPSTTLHGRDLTEPRRRAMLGLARARWEVGDYGEAIHNFESALQITTDEALRAKILIQEAYCWGPTCFGKGNTSRSRALLNQAQRCRMEETDRIEANLALASIVKFEGDIHEANALLSEAENALAKTGDRRRLADVYTRRRSVYLSLGQITNAQMVAQKALAIFEETQDMLGLADAYYDLGTIYWHKGQYPEALKAYECSLAIDEKLGSPNRLCWTHVYVALVHQSAGEFDLESLEAKRAEKHLENTDTVYLAMAVKGLHLDVSIERGEIETAERLCGELRTMFNSCSWTTRTPTRGMTYAYQGKLLARKQNKEGSDHAFARAIELLEGTVLGVLTKALVFTWWGESQSGSGRPGEARDKFESAMKLYLALGNEWQVSRMEALIGETASKF